MDFVDRADDRPEPISIARCRELLGDEADTMTDQDVETDPPARRDDGAASWSRCIVESRRIPE